MDQPDRDRWSLSSWERHEPGKLPRPLRRAIEDGQVDATVTMTVEQFVAAAIGKRTRGASIRDELNGVTYNTTITQPTVGRPRLASVEVVIDDVESDTYPKGYRVPVPTLIELTSYVLAAQDEVHDQLGDDPGSVYVWKSGATIDSRLDAYDLLGLVQRGLGSKRIAEMFTLNVNTVNRWLREARRDHPELPWPARRRGPAPQTPDADPAPDNRKDIR